MTLADDRRVKTAKQDWPVETLQTWITRGTIVLQPDFQREYVWHSTKASRLIESLLLEIPVPVVYVAQEPDSSFLVVDGQQRLTSVSAFITGTFPDGSEFKLKGLETYRELNGLRFRDLTTPIQQKVLGATLPVIIIEKDSHPDVKFEVFERLNLGSEQLNDQELRNSMYRGSYNELLKELSRSKQMLRVMRADKPHPRMKDRALILRFFAWWRNTHLNYPGSIKPFINREMREHRDALPDDLANLRSSFLHCMDMTFHVFGDNAFRRFHSGDDSDPNGHWERSKLNVALWDTVLYQFKFYDRRTIVMNSDRIREELLDLMTNDAKFSDYIQKTTDNQYRVRYRGDEWRRRLESLMANETNESRSFTLELKQQLYTANPTCALCGQRIHELDDAEVDHIEHYWRGGRTIPENARLAHRYCNRSRGGGEFARKN